MKVKSGFLAALSAEKITNVPQNPGGTGMPLTIFFFIYII